MPGLGESRVVRHGGIEAEAAEPSIAKVEMHFVAQAALGADAEAVADDPTISMRTISSGSIEGRPMLL